MSVQGQFDVSYQFAEVCGFTGLFYLGTRVDEYYFRIIVSWTLSNSLLKTIKTILKYLYFDIIRKKCTDIKQIFFICVSV